MGSKKPKAYVPENLEHFAKNLQQIRSTIDGKDSCFRLNIDKLQKAIESLPKENRENLERFWGLTGGTNHSKKIISSKDIAFIKMRQTSIASINMLFKLEYIFIYDEYAQTVVSRFARKIDKNGIQISDIEAIKYLLAFVVILQNGPKMCFETDALSIDMECRDDFIYDEYSLICETSAQLEKIPDNSIKLGLLMGWMEMLDYKDFLAIRRKFRIGNPKDYTLEEVEPLETFVQIRNFKEKLFPYGAWDATSTIIFGNTEEKLELEGFMEGIDEIRKDWSKVEDFKTGQMKLKTLHELRTLNVYKIGKLEFTDIYEVMFLYLERNLITSEN